VLRWLDGKGHPVTTSSGVRRSLEDRVVLCVDCDANRTLSVFASGNLVCSSCGSDNWMHLPTTAIVKQSVFVTGELIVEEDLTIEGRVEGRIELKGHNLWISPGGKVNAEIHAKSVIIVGNVRGRIYASDMVEIRFSGSVQGNIRCPRISIADGAKFNGNIDTEPRAGASTRIGFAKDRICPNDPCLIFGQLFPKSEM
jgi:cytoskeletal protein CcmA (bactofilin family)